MPNYSSNENTYVNSSKMLNFIEQVRRLKREKLALRIFILDVDSAHHPMLHRALSTISANQILVNNQRNVLAKNYRRTSVNDEIVTIDHNDADTSFTLPNLYELSEDLRIRVMDNLIDTPTMTALEETRRLNWWMDKQLPCPKLYPLITSGDGNCLLHAASLAMWGFHDHSLSMRKALNETLTTSKPNNSLYRRWRWAQSVENKKYGLVFSEQEWNEEWKNLLKLSSIEPRISQTKSSDLKPTDDTNHSKSLQTNTNGSTEPSSQLNRQYYESLEEFHVYVLANNIRRPIVVYSDTILRTNKGEAISPIEFGGIYLPLEIPPDKCHKQPIFLAFDAAHFSALVPMEQICKSPSKVTYRIPLIDIDTLDLLPIHFFLDPGVNFQWPVDEELSDNKIRLYTNYRDNRMNILGKYLNLSKEYSSLNNFISQVMSVPDDQTSTIDFLNSTSITYIDPSSEMNSTMISKKSSRPSLNSFSKIIRRTFMQPFSSTKRISFKHQHLHHHHPIPDIPNLSISNENRIEHRKSVPILNLHIHTLTIILTDLQPKRPPTSDDMIKNYIQTCMNEYKLEKENLQNINRSINQYFQETTTNPEETSGQTPTPLDSSANTTISPEHTENNRSIDNNEDLSLIDNDQFSTNINYVQRKSNQLTQSNSLKLNNDQTYSVKSQVNGISNKLLPNNNSTSRSLKRQQSLSSDKNLNNQQFIDSKSTNINKRPQQFNFSSYI